MIIRNRLIEAEFIKQRTLIVVLTSHHRPSPTKYVVRRRNHCSPKPSNHFCNKICQKRTFTGAVGTSITCQKQSSQADVCWIRCQSLPTKDRRRDDDRR